MIITFYPEDSLFFKDAKPFDAGEDNIAHSIFPPYPSTIYGALRGLIATQIGLKENDTDNYPVEIKGNIDNCKIKVNGTCLISNNIFYFKAPYNLVKKDKSSKIKFLKPEKNNSIISAEKNFSSYNSYISNNELEQILINNDTIKEEFTEPSTLFENFIKTGIKISSNSRTVEEGQLYSSIHFQLKSDSGIAIFLENNELFEKIPEKGFGKLGGEMRPIYYKKIINDKIINENIIKQLSDKIFENKNFFLWTITPAIFQNGYLPDFVDYNSLKGKIELEHSEYLEIKLVSCQMDKPLYIGGFDIEKKVPKKMYKAVPSGAIYFFKIIGETNRGLIEKLIEKFMLKPLKSIIDNGNFEKQGFGCAIIGGW